MPSDQNTLPKNKASYCVQVAYHQRSALEASQGPSTWANEPPKSAWNCMKQVMASVFCVTAKALALESENSRDTARVSILTISATWHRTTVKLTILHGYKLNFDHVSGSIS